MKLKQLYYVLLLVVVALGTSCSTTRKMKSSETFGGLSSEDFIQKVIEESPEWKVFNAKTSISLYSESGKRTKVKGILSIKRNETVRLSVAPLLGIEFFRLEISPDQILVVDRMNKRYMQCSMEELSRLVDMNVTYNVFQSLFLNELFTADSHHQLRPSDYRKFKVSQYMGETLIEPVKNKNIDFKFYTNTDDGRLEKTTMAIQQFRLNWDYDDFSYVEEKNFPHYMRISSEGLGSATCVELDLSNVSVGGKWNAATRISPRYSEVKLAELIRMLFKK